MGLDTMIFRWANNLVSYSWWTFLRAVDIDEPTWIMAAAALAAMWFAGNSTATHADYARGMGKERKEQKLIRSHVVLLFIAMACSFVFARALQHFFPQPRPMAAVSDMQAPIEPQDWHTIKAAISTQGAFPSDHAVMWFLMATGVFWLNRRAGVVAYSIALLCSIMRVGAGYHWPSDMAAGAALGVAVVVVAFALLRRVAVLQQLLGWVVGLFDRFPVFMHMLGFLILWDFSEKFSTLFAILAMILGKPVSH